MKREELEIGDWVYHDDIVFGREIAKIDRLNKAKNRETIGVTVYSSDGAFCVVGYILTSPTNNDIHPIPLTPEILENNGFTQVGCSDSPLWEYDNFAMVKICDEWKIRVVTFLATTYTVRYVHELQQFMRKICDNKYIDNQIFL